MALIGGLILFERPLKKERDEGGFISGITLEGLSHLSWLENGRIKFEFEKQGESFFFHQDSKVELNQKKVRRVIERIGRIQKMQRITKKEIESLGIRHFVDEQAPQLVFSFKNKKIIFTLGHKLLHDTGFYLKVKDAEEEYIIVGRSFGSTGEIYQQKELHNTAVKYKKLENLFHSKLSFYFEKKPFQNVGKFKELKFSKGIQRSFLAKRDAKGSLVVFPSPRVPVPIDQTIFSYLQKEVSSLESKNIIWPFDHNLLKKSLRKLEVTFLDGKKRKYEIFQKYGSLYGTFLNVSGQKGLYEVEGKFLGPFFSNYRDFWEKRPLRSRTLDGSSLSFTLFDGKKKYELFIPKSLDFHIEDRNGKSGIYNQSNLKKIFALLFSSADDVLEAKGDEKGVGMNIFGTKLILKEFKNKLLIINKNTGLLYLYRTGIELKMIRNLKDIIL